MKLCAIYCVWADYDWLELSMENIKPHVNGIIIIYSRLSNYGEVCEETPNFYKNYTEGYPHTDKYINSYHYLPKYVHASQSETDKRNYGLHIAMEQGFTHFIMMDADEFYDPIEFRKAKEYLNSKPNLNGLVCRSQVYVKSPTLTIGLDTTLVPFIHKITPGLQHCFNKNYPFAWEGRNIRIDPTRSLNINSGVEMIDVTMHHYSWVRKDYDRKIRNSTARPNIEKMDLAKKIVHLKEGDVFDLYHGKPLVHVPNKFGLPEIWENGLVKSTE